MKALKQEAHERLLSPAAQQDPARFAELYEINFERVYELSRAGWATGWRPNLTAEVFHQVLANLKRFEWLAPHRFDPPESLQ